MRYVVSSSQRRVSHRLVQAHRAHDRVRAARSRQGLLRRVCVVQRNMRVDARRLRVSHEVQRKCKP